MTAPPRRSSPLRSDLHRERPTTMRAVTAVRPDPQDPLAGLQLERRPLPVPPPGWARVTVRAAALNRHDLWTLQGVGAHPDWFPVVLGTDAAGVDENGDEVVVHAVLGDPAAGGGDETCDPHRRLLSEGVDGTLATHVVVPRRNLVPKPPELTFEQAACLPGAWLTAYRMLFDRAGVQPGATVLVQGAGGGVASALIALGAAAGFRMWATSRSAAKREFALGLGAELAVPCGETLPDRVDAVMETVGEATWAHSVRSLRPGGRIVVSGATSGAMPPAELSHVFYRQLSVVGSTMGTRDHLAHLAAFCAATDVRPAVDRVLPLELAHEGFRAMLEGVLLGKVVLVP